jgi:hypothetical protein
MLHRISLLCLAAMATTVAGCASHDIQSRYTPSGQRVDFVTNKSPTFGASPMTVAFVQAKPGAKVSQPIGIAAGQAVETTALSAIGGGLSQGMGYGLASKVFSTGTSAITGGPGNTNVGSIFINATAQGGGATNINR